MWEMNTQFFLSTVMDFRLFDFTIDNSISCCECIPYDRLVLIFPKVIFFSYAVFLFLFLFAHKRTLTYKRFTPEKNISCVNIGKYQTELETVAAICYLVEYFEGSF